MNLQLPLDSAAAADILGANPGTIVGGIFGIGALIVGIVGPPWVKRRQARRTPVPVAQTEGELDRQNLRHDLDLARADNKRLRAEATWLWSVTSALDYEVRAAIDGYEATPPLYPPPPRRLPWPPRPPESI